MLGQSGIKHSGDALATEEPARQFHGIMVVLGHSHLKCLQTPIQQPRHVGIRGGTVQLHHVLDPLDELV